MRRLLRPATSRPSTSLAGRWPTQRPGVGLAIARASRPLRALGRALVFFFKVFPMLPSRPIDWLTRPPVVERVCYPTGRGPVEGDLYRPAGGGPHPGMVVCLGVVPFGVEHPQVAVLGRALARAGFAALLYWSPAMRDFRLDPADIEDIARAYRWLIDQPSIDPARSGLLGTCVGGAFALMAAASPTIADRVGFLSAYAPYCSLWTLARDIASARRAGEAGREPWAVDPLTRKVFVHSLTAPLAAAEAERLDRAALTAGAALDEAGLSADGRAVVTVLSATDETTAMAALRRLPPAMQARLDALSPLTYQSALRAPLIVLLHDRGDPVIPVDESHRLVATLAGRTGLHYTEMRFQHLDPLRGKLPLGALLRELGKFFAAVYPIFRQAVV